MRSISRALVGALSAALLLGACTETGGDTPDAASTSATTVEIPGDIDDLTAEELILRLYEDQDADLAVALAADGSVPPEIRDSVRTSLGGLLDGEATIAETLSYEVQGVTLTEVDTDDGVRWCVRPDNRILIQCRVGIADVEVDTGDLELDVVRAEVDVFPEEFQLRLQFRPSGDDPVQFPGVLTLFGENGDPAPFLQTQAAIANSGEIVAQVERDTAALPGTTLLLAWVSDRNVDLSAPLELRWEGGAMPVAIQEPEWWVGG